jgi:type II secretory pathway component GspD/PulD (secretin)
MKIISKVIITLAMLSILKCGTVSAQTVPAANTSNSSKLVTLDYVNADVTDILRAISTQSGANIAISPNAKGQITIHLRDKTVDEAVHFVANMAGLGARKINGAYVIAPRSDMRQTLARLGTPQLVPLEHLSPKDAADLITNAFPDLTARPQGNAVELIGTSDDIAQAIQLLQQNDAITLQSEHVVERVALKNISAKDAADAIVKMTPGITAQPAGDSVVLSGTRADIKAAEKGLELIDVPSQPDSEVEVYNIKYASPVDLANIVKKTFPDVNVISGPDSNAPSNPILNTINGTGTSGMDASMGNGQSSGNQNTGGSSSSGQSQQYDQQSGFPGGSTNGKQVNPRALSLLLQGNPDEVKQAIKVLAMVDVPPQQMLIDAKVVETNPELINNIGVQWSWNPFQFLERPQDGAPSTSSSSSSSSSSLPVMNSLGFGNFGRTQFNPSATLNLLIQKNEAKMLANPSITVLDDQNASVFIGDTLRYQVVTSGINGPTIQVFEVPVGIILLVHPKINSDGYITMNIHPEVSTATMVNNLPQTHTREASTVVRVKDGDTLVIGGLISDQDIRQMSKIPLLGDLPIIGRLFRNYTHDHTHDEVMIFLTIHIVH